MCTGGRRGGTFDFETNNLHKDFGVWAATIGCLIRYVLRPPGLVEAFGSESGNEEVLARPLLYVGGGPSYRNIMLKDRAKLLVTEQLEPPSMRGRRKARSSRARRSSHRGRASRHTRCSRLGFCNSSRTTDVNQVYPVFHSRGSQSPITTLLQQDLLYKSLGGVEVPPEAESLWPVCVYDYMTGPTTLSCILPVLLRGDNSVLQRSVELRCLSWTGFL